VGSRCGGGASQGVDLGKGTSAHAEIRTVQAGPGGHGSIKNGRPGAVSTQAQNLAAPTGRPARRPWTRVGAVAVAAHVFYELVDGEQVEGAEFTPDVENELWRREQAVAQRAAQTRPSTSCAVAWNRVSRSEKVIASLRKLSEWGQLA